MNIGWFGLGSIGTQMVVRLRAFGHAVTVFPRGGGLAEVQAAGATPCPSHKTIAATSDALVLCVFSDAQVRDVLFDNGVLAALRPGASVILHTTGSPVLARRIAAAAPTGVDVIDATFSGGPMDVAAGRLTVMAGGDAAAIARMTPLLQSYAARVHHVGTPGQGQTIKLLNNLLFAANLINAAEMLRLAEAQDLDSSVVAQTLTECSGASYALDLFKSPAPAAIILNAVRPYMHKDVAAALAAAADAGLDVSAFAKVADYFTR